jgi:ParB/RepB/Spo0J family partition protein
MSSSNNVLGDLAAAAANRRPAAAAEQTPAAEQAPAKVSRREKSAPVELATAPAEPEIPAVPFAVPVEEIAFNPYNRRQINMEDPTTAEEIEQLAASLKKGQIAPIAVISRDAWDAVYGDEHAERIGDAKWVQIPGGRRLTAARKHGIKTLEIIVKNDMASRESLLVMTAVENLQRLDLSPLEESEQIWDLWQAVGESSTKVANRIHRSNAYVSQRFDLIRLCPALRDELRSGTMTLEDAREVVKLIKAEITDEKGQRVKQPKPGVTIPDAAQLVIWEQYKADKAAKDAPPVEPQQETAGTGTQDDQDDQDDQGAGKTKDTTPKTPSVKLTADMEPAEIGRLLASLGYTAADLTAVAATMPTTDQDDADQDDAEPVTE